MLTDEQEKEWLESRGLSVVHDWKDAAEFEARVQKRLMYQYEKAFHCKDVSGGFLPNRQTMLMYARIAVESEMEQAQR